ncbi:MAG: hypothetical protein KBG29_09515 [Pseudomonadales bacterium]|jgi:hypothetical protein|nr:hypothetical protein [Pseudomonadales bacterium]
MHRYIARVLTAACLMIGVGALSTGCAAWIVMAGAGAGAAAYEIPNVRAMQALEEDFRKEPRRSYEEYEEYMRRKHQIQEQSLVY